MVYVRRREPSLPTVVVAVVGVTNNVCVRVSSSSEELPLNQVILRLYLF